MNENHMKTSVTTGEVSLRWAKKADQRAKSSENGPISPNCYLLGLRRRLDYGPRRQKYHENAGNNHLKTVNIRSNGKSRTNNGKGQTYQWDAENRLVQIAQGSNTYQFAYDGMGRRISETDNGTLVKQWVWVGSTLAEERDGSTPAIVTKRFFAQGEQQAVSGTATPYYRARYYSPQIGRFISRDPLKYAELRQGPNLYWYVANNAVNKVDPSGLDCCKVKFINFDVSWGTAYWGLQTWELVLANCLCVAGSSTGQVAQAQVAYWAWGVFPMNTISLDADMSSGGAEAPGAEDASGDLANSVSDVAEAAAQSGNIANEPDMPNGSEAQTTQTALANANRFTPADGQAACDQLLY